MTQTSMPGVIARLLGTHRWFLLLVSGLLLTSIVIASEDPPIRCEEDTVQVFGTAISNELYVDRAYLRMLVDLHQESLTLESIVEVILKSGLSALETTNKDRGGNALVLDVPVSTPLIRISVKRLGDPACDSFKFVKQYPALAWPWLRRLGLRSNQCIGVEHLAAEGSSAPVRVVVDETRRSLYGGQWQSRMEVRAMDASTNPPRVLAQMTQHFAYKGGGQAGYHHGYACKGGAERTAAFGRVHAAAAIPRQVIEIVREQASLPDVGDLSDAELNNLVWVAAPGKVWAHLVGSPDGMAWVGPGVGGYALRILREGQIVSIPISIPEKVVWNELAVTGLAKTREGWAVIAGTKLGLPEWKRYLIEFHPDRGIVKLSAVNESQFERLLVAK